MGKHLEAVVHPHVELQIPEYGTCSTILQITYPKGKGLFILLLRAGCTKEYLAINTGRQNVGYRVTRGVLFNIYRCHFKERLVALILFQAIPEFIEVKAVPSPLSAYQFKAGKAQDYRLIPSFHKHPDKPYGSEITDWTDLLIRFKNGYLELYPPGLHRFAVGQGLTFSLADICDIRVA